MDLSHLIQFHVVKMNNCKYSNRCFTIEDNLFKNGHSFFSDRICVDSLKRYHLFSNVTARKKMVRIREIRDEMKIGTFRLRRKQLEALGLFVCEINYRRYKNILHDKKFTYLQESITQM